MVFPLLYGRWGLLQAAKKNNYCFLILCGSRGLYITDHDVFTIKNILGATFLRVFQSVAPGSIKEEDREVIPRDLLTYTFGPSLFVFLGLRSINW